MKSNLWKIISVTTSVAVLLTAFCFPAVTSYAANSVVISSAVFEATGTNGATEDQIKITFATTGDSLTADHQTTIMVYDVFDVVTASADANQVLQPTTVSGGTGTALYDAVKTAKPSETDSTIMGYIDQFTNANGTAIATFPVKGIKTNKLYAVRMGGSGVTSVGVALVNTVSANPKPATPAITVDFSVLSNGADVANNATVGKTVTVVDKLTAGLTFEYDVYTGSTLSGTYTAFPVAGLEGTAGASTKYRLKVYKKGARAGIDPDSDPAYVDFTIDKTAPVINLGITNNHAYTNSAPATVVAPSTMDYTAVTYYTAASALTVEDAGWTAAGNTAPAVPATDGETIYVKLVVEAKSKLNDLTSSATVLYSIKKDSNVTGPTIGGTVVSTNAYEANNLGQYVRTKIDLGDDNGKYKLLYNDGAGYSVEILYSPERDCYDALIKGTYTFEDIKSKITPELGDPTSFYYGHPVSLEGDVTVDDYMAIYDIYMFGKEETYIGSDILSTLSQTNIMRVYLSSDVLGTNEVTFDSVTRCYDKYMVYDDGEDFEVID